MTTALATTSNQTRALARFGSEADIQMLMERQASIYGIEKSEVARPDVQASLIKATQYSISYGYLPGIHIHMLPFNKKVKKANGQEDWIKSYEPALGEKAWKDSADKQAQIQGFSYLVETQEMTVAEVKAATAADPTAEYSDGDAGFKARVLRSDHANIYRTMGRQYDPEWSYGFWRKKASQKDEWVNGRKTGKKIWVEDTIPSQRSPRDVAERRAYKAALMKVFSLLPLDQFDEARRFKSLSAYVETETAVDNVLMAQPHATHYDEDGLLMWGEATDGQYRTVDTDTGEVQFMQAPPVTPVTPISPATDGKQPKTQDEFEYQVARNFVDGKALTAPADDVDMVSTVQLKKLNALGTQLYGAEWTDEKRHALVAWKTKNRTQSSKELTADEADSLIAGLQKRINEAAAEMQTAPADNPFETPEPVTA